MFPLYSPSFLRDEYNARVEAALRNQQHAAGARQVPGVADWLRLQLRRITNRLRRVQARRTVDNAA